jgi:hypothetical protein
VILEKLIIAIYSHQQIAMSDSKPSKKVIKDWVDVHDDFEDEPILHPIVEKPPKKSGTPQRYITLSKWEDDPGEAIQDPDYWINHIL